MTEPRLSTVFDYSDLRLHPDGTRVYQKSTNLKPRIAKVAVRTSRNNWIARDAGGHANIRQFKRIRETSQDLQEGGEFLGLKTDTDSRKPEDEEGEFNEQGKKRKIKRFDGRQVKRQKFLENYDYLRNGASTSNNDSSDARMKCFPCEPTSDLLKCIHRYASEYYTASGQLLNSSRDYRKQKKARRDKKKAEDRTEISVSPTTSRTSTPPGSESDASDGNCGNEGGSEADKGKLKEKRKAKRKGRQRIAKQYRDMYKVFDGSAIMAIGMLVQEYIAEVLDPQPPGEREEEMSKAFTIGYTSEDEGDDTIDDITRLAGSDSSDEVGSDEQDDSIESTSDESMRSDDTDDSEAGDSD